MFKILFRVLTFILIISLFACSSVPGSRSVEESDSPVHKIPAAETESAFDLTSNSGNTAEIMMWNTLPINNHPVFFAAASRQSNRKSELEECIREAAKQASMFYVLSAEAQTVEQRQGSSTGYHGNVSIGFDIEFAAGLVPEIEIIEASQNQNGTFIRAIFDSIKCIPLNYNLGNSNKPLWINNPPKIEGYYSAVGTVRRSNLLIDSLYSLDGQALVELLKQIAITIQSEKQEILKQSGSTISSESSSQISAGIIKDFFIISRWTPPNGAYYYALAVCTEGIEQ